MMAESIESDNSEILDISKSPPNIDHTITLDEEPSASVSLEGSVVASPSIESFSTLPEGESSLSLADAVNDLVVRVDGPQKQSDLLETYITFRVSTKTTREGYGAAAFSVRRRYNDFIWVRQHLVESYPTHIVPPLPGKHSIIGQFDRYGREFVTARMNALQMFLNRVVKHPILSFAPCFKCFLTSNSEEFLELRKLTTTSFLNKVSVSWKSLSTLHLEANRPPELNKLFVYLGELSAKLNQLSRILQRIRQERVEQGRETCAPKQALRAWAGSDPDLDVHLCAVATALEKCELGLQDILLETENIIITQPLREYILYVEAVKETLLRRDDLEIEYLYRLEQLGNKCVGKETAEADTGDGRVGLRGLINNFKTKEDRVAKLTQEIQSLRVLVEESKDRLECANANVCSDAERWTQDKQEDLKNMLLAFADQHINYYDQCVRAWEEASVTVRPTTSSNSGAPEHGNSSSSQSNGESSQS